MSEEPKCVCGHGESEHRTPEYYGLRWCSHDGCECVRFLEALPWPDSEGLWWCNRTYHPIVKIHDRCGLCIVHEGDMHFQSDWEHDNGATQFVKMLEPNPFTESGGTET